jgi:hypothetical protein
LYQLEANAQGLGSNEWEAIAHSKVDSDVHVGIPGHGDREFRAIVIAIPGKMIIDSGLIVIRGSRFSER